MNPSTPQLRHRLIQGLGKRQSNRKGSSGFTLIELLIVVIIVGILSAIALPAFLGQANKAKASAAKSLVSSLAKECQVALVEGTASGWDPNTTQTVTGSSEVSLVNGTVPDYVGDVVGPGGKDAVCSTTTENNYTSAIVGSADQSFSIKLTTAGGIEKSCTGTNGCSSTGKW